MHSHIHAKPSSPCYASGKGDSGSFVSFPVTQLQVTGQDSKTKPVLAGLPSLYSPVYRARCALGLYAILQGVSRALGAHAWPSTLKGLTGSSTHVSYYKTTQTKWARNSMPIISVKMSFKEQQSHYHIQVSHIKQRCC